MLAQGKSQMEQWMDTYVVLKQAIQKEREINPAFAREFDEIDEDLDDSCEVTGWLEDFFEELEVRELWDEVIRAVDEIIPLFDWKEISADEFRIKRTMALNGQKKFEESVTYCKEWYQETECENAAAMMVYSLIGAKDYSAAESLVEQYISDETECTDENEILFRAAQVLYQKQKKKSKEKKIAKQLDAYEKRLEELFDCFGDDMDLDDWEEELPFS